MTTADPVSPIRPSRRIRTEKVPAALLHVGVVVIEDGRSRAKLIAVGPVAGQIRACTDTLERKAWDPQDLVTVAAESLPASYWLFKYNQLCDAVWTLTDDLIARAAEVTARRDDNPDVRAAHAFELGNTVAELRTLKGLRPNAITGAVSNADPAAADGHTTSH